MGMANLRAGPTAGDDMATGVSGLFRTRYPEMVRLADLLGADDPEDIAQEAFARLLRKYDSLRDPDAALAYVRASVCNLTRNRHRHLRVVRLRTVKSNVSRGLAALAEALGKGHEHARRPAARSAERARSAIARQ